MHNINLIKAGDFPALFISFSCVETHPGNGIGHLMFTISYSSIHDNWSSLILRIENCDRVMVKNTQIYIVIRCVACCGCGLQARCQENQWTSCSMLMLMLLVMDLYALMK